MTSIHWLLNALLSLFLYGLWGFFGKLATNYIDPKSALAYDVIGVVLFGLVFFATNKLQWQGDIRGIAYAAAAGISGIAATLCFFTAVSKGSAVVVLPLTSLYPVVTVLLAFFVLKEPITARHLFGIGLTITALILFSQPD